MAKVTAPLLSFGARGQIGDSMVFASWRGIQYARQKVIPANPRTLAQQETRTVFRTASQLWTLAPLSWKEVWNAFAQGRQFTGRNRFLGDNVRYLRDQTNMVEFIFSPGAKGGIPLASMSADGGVGSATVTLGFPEVPPGWTAIESVTVALLDQNPEGPYSGPVVAEIGEGLNDTVVVSGLDEPGTYVIGTFLKWEKPNGEMAFSVALSDTAIVT